MTAGLKLILEEAECQAWYLDLRERNLRTFFAQRAVSMQRRSPPVEKWREKLCHQNTLTKVLADTNSALRAPKLNGTAPKYRPQLVWYC
jgi:hypothetical protein